jgi:hypothetical protein
MPAVARADHLTTTEKTFMNTKVTLLPTSTILGSALLLFACNDNNTASPPRGDASVAETSTMDAPSVPAMDGPIAPTIEAATDAPAVDAPLAQDAQVDAGSEAATATPTFLTKLDKSQGQLTEGLWEVMPSAVKGIGTNGTPILSYAVLGKIVAVAGDGGTPDFAVATAC